MNRFRVLLTVLLFLMIPLPLRAEPSFDLDDEGLEETAVQNFSFHSHLSEAAVALIPDGKGRIPAEWKKDHFEFPGYPPEIGLRPVEVRIEGASRKGIRFDPADKSAVQARFPKVTQGTRMTVYYGVQKGKQLQKTVYYYLQVYVGKKLVRRIRASSEEGWRQEVIDLGVLSFLNREVAVTFFATSDHPSGSYLILIPEIQP